MNTTLAPTYQYMFGEHWVLWYANSNNYSVVDHRFKDLLDIYFSSKSSIDFSNRLLSDDKHADPEEIEHVIETYLEQSQHLATNNLQKDTKFNPKQCDLFKCYQISNRKIAVYFGSELIQQLIHPAIAHLEIPNHSRHINTSFHMYLEGDDLCLFKDENFIISVPKREYHHVQGKFIFHLINESHQKDENDWLATFHGSTITNNKSAVVLVGHSGKGKSTLSGLLAAHGLWLLADDVSPMLAADHHIYFNPTGLSIKEGSFNILQPLIPNFENYQTTQFNAKKGKLKHINFPKPKKDHYPCKAVVMVNYEPNSKTSLVTVTIKELLEVLIPESWLSHSVEHAKLFLDWLGSVSIYKLTYSESTEGIKSIKQLFNDLVHH